MLSSANQASFKLLFDPGEYSTPLYLYASDDERRRTGYSAMYGDPSLCYICLELTASCPRWAIGSHCQKIEIPRSDAALPLTMPLNAQYYQGYYERTDAVAHAQIYMHPHCPNGEIESAVPATTHLPNVRYGCSKFINTSAVGSYVLYLSMRVNIHGIIVLHISRYAHREATPDAIQQLCSMGQTQLECPAYYLLPYRGCALFDGGSVLAERDRWHNRVRAKRVRIAIYVCDCV